jgi:hypothetical protein
MVPVTARGHCPPHADSPTEKNDQFAKANGHFFIHILLKFHQW